MTALLLNALSCQGEISKIFVSPWPANIQVKILIVLQNVMYLSDLPSLGFCMPIWLYIEIHRWSIRRQIWLLLLCHYYVMVVSHYSVCHVSVEALWEIYQHQLEPCCKWLECSIFKYRNCHPFMMLAKYLIYWKIQCCYCITYTDKEILIKVLCFRSILLQAWSAQYWFVLFC